MMSPHEFSQRNADTDTILRLQKERDEARATLDRLRAWAMPIWEGKWKEGAMIDVERNILAHVLEETGGEPMPPKCRPANFIPNMT